VNNPEKVSTEMIRAILIAAIGLALLVPFGGTVQCVFSGFAHGLAGESFGRDCETESFEKIADKLGDFLAGFRANESRLNEVDASLNAELRNAGNAPSTKQWRQTKK